ncbi:hypothetical protein [Pseudomonas coronafaciens]|uniref:hypothetical protein n=1 Tax=Pseudomonas coronafaciens TaxID=53409 RepID=UPI000E3DA80C|nr:hypothetical protein [Pseudomonas coronafaciens]RMV90773.1 hypothetical protein ALP02_200077 [Pseudomonas coronafaciens pv. garcae]
MAKRLTVEQMDARYEALAEASEHLCMNWTDKPIEAVEGEIMADWLHAQAVNWLAKAQAACATWTVSDASASPSIASI